jgi:chromosome segregation ATPase
MRRQSRKNEEDINAAHATLRDISEQNKLSIEKLEDDKIKADEAIVRLRSRAETLEQELRDRGAEIDRLKTTTLQKIGDAVSNVLGGLWDLVGASSSVAANHPGSILSQAH